MKQPERVQIPVPRLRQEVKEMNGKSTKRLSQCIEALEDLLDANDETQHDEVSEQPRAVRNPNE